MSLEFKDGKQAKKIVDTFLKNNLEDDYKNTIEVDYEKLIRENNKWKYKYNFVPKEKNNVNLNPFFILKWIGAKGLKFESDSKEISYAYDTPISQDPDNKLELALNQYSDELKQNKENKIIVKDIISIKKHDGWFLDDLVIKDKKNSITIQNLTDKQASYIENKFLLLSRRHKFIDALEKFTSLYNEDSYSNQNKIDSWLEEFKSLNTLIGKTKVNLLDSLESEFNNIYKNIDKKIFIKNTEFIKFEKIIFKSLFDKLEENPLTESQREAIINDNDNLLVVAGAGTGKTSTVIGKIVYLIKRKIVKPNEILALTFGRDASQEIQVRIESLVNEEIKIKTFHGLGHHIVTDANGVKIKISDSANDPRTYKALISKLLYEMSGDKEYDFLLNKFITKDRYINKYLEDFDHQADYKEYCRKNEPITLMGEKVKSFEELLIADWLFLNGIKYVYEKPYEFNTANKNQQQYRPDFYIVKNGIYLEHFGIDRDGNTAPSINREKYNEGILWKRNKHKECNTILIESYSWERMEGTIHKNLEKKLNEQGIFCNPNDPNIKETINKMREIKEKTASLFGSFLSIYKEGQYTKKELNSYISQLDKQEKNRCKDFLKLFNKFFLRYENYLKTMQEKDYSDLIVMATNFINKGDTKLNFKRIIIDEYQDISRGRFRLLKSIIDKQKDSRIMCVGDDWQSIYGFNGSDITMTLDFEKIFGKFSRVDLDKSFRFTYPILNTSSIFIQKNPKQLRKLIEARNNPLEKAVQIAVPEVGLNFDLNQILELVEKSRPKNKVWELLILARYNYELEEIEDDQINAINKFKNIKVKLMTIHKSKGLGADAVVVLGLEAGRRGFPGYMDADPIMNMVLKGENDFPHAEERRTLYVAMTRAKELLILCTSLSNPSEFITELKNNNHYKDIFFDKDTINSSLLFCQECEKGQLKLKYPKLPYGFAWQCEYHPYCDGKAKFCKRCKKLPARVNGNICNDPNCTSH